MFDQGSFNSPPQEAQLVEPGLEFNCFRLALEKLELDAISTSSNSTGLSEAI